VSEYFGYDTVQSGDQFGLVSGAAEGVVFSSALHFAGSDQLEVAVKSGAAFPVAVDVFNDSGHMFPILPKHLAVLSPM